MLPNCVDNMGGSTNYPTGTQIDYSLPGFIFIGTLLLSAYKGFTEWSGFLGDEVITTAILDRLVFKCEILHIPVSQSRLSGNH